MRQDLHNTRDHKWTATTQTCGSSTGDAALVLVFRCGGTGEWSLRRAEVQCGAHTATFARGQVAKATAVFLGHEPLTPDVHR